MFLVLMLYGMFASVFTIAKLGMEYTQPLFLVGTRMFLAGIIMLGYQFLFCRQETINSNVNFRRIFWLAIFNIYLTNVFEFWGLKYLTSFKTCFIYSLSPFFAALLSYFVFAEKISWKKWTGLLIGFLGFIPILLNENSNEQELGHFWIFSWAELAVMGASICSVYGWIVLRQIVRDDGTSPFLANGYSMLLGGALALFHSWLVEDWNPFPVTEFLPFAECTVLLLVISNLICYNLYGSLLKKFSATFMSLAGFTTPFFTAFFGWLFLGETISWAFYVSAAFVFLGLVTFYQEELQRGYSNRTPETIPNN
jgi:drug/metabolite transporter (DMT)-like permease